MVKNSIIILLATLVVCLALFCLKERQEPVEPAEASVQKTQDVAGSAVVSIVDEMFRAPEFSSAALGFCLIDDQGDVVVDRQAAVSFIPASTLKTLTVTTALEVLGPEFRFETPLMAARKISDTG